MIFRTTAFIAAAATVAITTFSIGMISSPKEVRSASPTFESGLSASELDMMFGKDRPKKIGPHPLVYMTESEAKQVKGKLGPMAIPVITGIIAGGVGAASAYMSGSDARGIAVGGIAGFSGGYLGGFAGAVAGGGVRGAIAGGIAGGYGTLGTQVGCATCHQAKK